MNKKVSIIIPCYNEGKNIAKNIQDVIHQMEGWDIEIIAVNDGSTDNTADEILKMTNKHMGIVKLCSCSTNYGKGNAVYSGIRMSRHRQKLIIDADLSVRPWQINSFNEKDLPDQFIIKGQRVQVEPQPLYRIFLGKCWQVLVWMLTGINMDTQCPYTFLKVNDRFFEEMFIDGFAFDVEILYKAKCLGIKVFNQDVSYFNDTDTKVTPRKTYEMFKDLLRIRKKAF